MVISKNEQRNMQMVANPNGTTVHVPIDPNKPCNPKTGPHNPVGGKAKKKLQNND